MTLVKEYEMGDNNWIHKAQLFEFVTNVILNCSWVPPGNASQTTLRTEV